MRAYGSGAISVVEQSISRVDMICRCQTATLNCSREQCAAQAVQLQHGKFKVYIMANSGQRISLMMGKHIAKVSQRNSSPNFSKAF